MALQMNKDFPTGESANYWKITMMMMNYKTNTVMCTMSLFKDKKCCDEGKIPIETKSIGLKTFWEELCKYQDARELIYKKVKQTPFFHGSTDV